jgi:hypothetical protein
VVVLVTVIMCASCGGAPSQTQHQVDPDAKTRAAEASAAADEILTQMPPQDRAAFEQSVDRSILEQMTNAAAACGTRLVSTKEPKAEDRTYYVQQGATLEQLQCVQRRFPFVKAPL